MNRWGLIFAAGVALVAFHLGRTQSSAPVAFPDPSTARDAAEMEAEVARAIVEPRAFVRASTLIRLFESLTRENVEGAARAVTSRAAENDPVDLQLFLTAWAHLDPVGAIQEVQGWPIRSRREQGLRIVMREWAASGDRLAAGNYFDSVADESQRAILAAPLVRGWALSGDGSGALALAGRFFAVSPSADVIEAAVRGVLHSEGPAGAFALARSLDPEAGGSFAQNVIRTTLDLAGREDPRAAADYYDELIGADSVPPDWASGSLVRIAGLIRNDDPRAALDWLLPKPDQPEKSRALTETMGTWAKRDFDAAWSWFDQNCPAARHSELALSPTESAILAGLVRRYARIRPAEAAPWAIRLRPGAQRVEMLRRVAYFWSATHAAEVDAWIESLALEPPERAQVREAADWGRKGTSADPGTSPERS